MSVLFDELKALLKALQRGRIDYALCGGLALAVHGKPRATVDIDILIQPADEEKVRSVADKLGFNLPAAAMNFAEGKIKIRRVSKMIPKYAGDVLTLDMLLVTPAIESVWKQREVREWEGGEVCVLSRQGLIQMKTISARPNDLRDIEA